MRIGELGDAAGTTTKTLRFYEESGLLPQADRSANGYGDYGPEAISLLDFIHLSRRRCVNTSDDTNFIRPVRSLKPTKAEAPRHAPAALTCREQCSARVYP